MRQSVAVLVLLLAAACTSTPQATRPSADVVTPVASQQAVQWLGDVRAISDAGENPQRRAAIIRRMDAMGITWRKAPFVDGKHQGENLIADLGGPGSTPLLLIGAHSDRVQLGQGATDNASGSATVLALAQRLRAQPLQHHRVAIAFWDLEESGLLGSKAFVAEGKIKPALYVNFDVFGWGDTLWMMVPGQGQATLVDSSRSATQAIGIGFSPGEQYPPTDHLPFIRAGWPAVSYSLVGAEEIKQVLEAYAGKKPTSQAKVMSVIHSDKDTIDQIDATAAVRGIDAVEKALRNWDAASPVGPAPAKVSEGGQ